VRPRGRAIEAVLCELLVRSGDRTMARHLVGRIARDTGADYVIGTATSAATGAPLPLPLRSQGPVLTWRAVAADARQPPLPNWQLTMGDVELL
jgi:hypothetical protein